jgi:hypothetical protein
LEKIEDSGFEEIKFG